MEIVHQANILLHVVAGSFALLFGTVALLTHKGKYMHKRAGRVFLWLLAVVISTGLIGVFVFGQNTFLLVITVLSAYQGVSGYRVLQTKSNQFNWLDVCTSLISLSTVLYFLYYFKTIVPIWNPVIIYSTVGFLVLIIAYDFLRYFIPPHTYKNLWLYEHIYKMIGAFSAILSAFSGTVFNQYQPASQILPSVLGIGLQIGFIGYYYLRKRAKLNSQLPMKSRKGH
jgi:hypothetical protein